MSNNLFIVTLFVKKFCYFIYVLDSENLVLQKIISSVAYVLIPLTFGLRVKLISTKSEKFHHSFIHILMVNVFLRSGNFVEYS